jgi:hypothetical protein
MKDTAKEFVIGTLIIFGISAAAEDFLGFHGSWTRLLAQAIIIAGAIEAAKHFTSATDTKK